MENYKKMRSDGSMSEKADQVLNFVCFFIAIELQARKATDQRNVSSNV